MFIDFEGRSGFCLIPQSTKYSCPVANCPDKGDEKQDAGIHLVRFFFLKNKAMLNKNVVFSFHLHHLLYYDAMYSHLETIRPLSNVHSFHLLRLNTNIHNTSVLNAQNV